MQQLVMQIQKIIGIYMKTMRMKIVQKSSLVMNKILEGQSKYLKTIHYFIEKPFQKGLKYVDFNLKANKYGFNYCIWLYNKIEYII